jgi:transposase
MKIFQVSYKTIYNWFNRWELDSMIGLYNKPGRGCKSKFNTEQKEKIREFVKPEPRQLKQVVQKVKEEWGIISSKKTIQKILKILKMSWYRMRRGIGGEPPTHIYQEKKA